ncbi:Protein of unknown function [Bacillus mycoides]|uniref:Uncharacterized protein n=1 Tax=Bacillus mycoides TaxID=1405 RepID=A0A1D3MP49_BACMY|nr:Protein of unknown function [Bacillus mycoides]SCM87732.1 Protein of unknown function [Bacillus mycoides]
MKITYKQWAIKKH